DVLAIARSYRPNRQREQRDREPDPGRASDFDQFVRQRKSDADQNENRGDHRSAAQSHQQGDRAQSRKRERHSGQPPLFARQVGDDLKREDRDEQFGRDAVVEKYPEHFAAVIHSLEDDAARQERRNNRKRVKEPLGRTPAKREPAGGKKDRHPEPDARHTAAAVRRGRQGERNPLPQDE